MATQTTSSNSRNNFAQLLNTAIVKSKEQTISSNFKERLENVCQSKAVEAIGYAARHLAESKNISNDQAMIELIETFRELDAIWSDYVTMEGLNQLKNLLAGNRNRNNLN